MDTSPVTDQMRPSDYERFPLCGAKQLGGTHQRFQSKPRPKVPQRSVVDKAVPQGAFS
jgi:hypothetical protein